MTQTARILLLLPSLIAGLLTAAPEEFVYFRHDNGVAKMAGRLPERLDVAPRWRTTIDSGHSTPILVGNRIFLTAYNLTSEKLSTVAINATNGAMLWSRAVPAQAIEPFHRQSGSGAPCTPASDGQRVYAFFGSYGLICYDLDGAVVWEHRMGPFRDEYGAGSSPVLVEDQVVLSEDHDIDSFLIAINRFTGKTTWQASRPDAVRSYSTPAVWNHGGRKELVVPGALEIAGYNSATGEKLWWKRGLARIVIPAPLISGDMVYIAAWAPGGDATSRITFPPWDVSLERWDRDKNGKLTRNEIDDSNVLERFFRMDLDQNASLDQNEWERHANVFRRAENCAIALKPSGRGELSDSDVKWKHTRGVPYVPTALLDNGIFWMVKDGGIVTKLDAGTGKILQEERLGAGGQYLASPVSGDGKVYFCSEQGVVTVVGNEREWRVISARPFREKINASPVIGANQLIIRTEKALYAF